MAHELLHSFYEMHPSIDKFTKTTMDDMVSFCEITGTKPRCGSCHHNDFDIPTMRIGTIDELEDGTHLTTLRPFSIPDEKLGGAHNLIAYPFTCKRCGTVLLVNARFVLDTLNANEKGAPIVC